MPGDHDLIQSSIDYLKSNKAIQLLSRDPYYPKWTAPWWHMALLHEIREGAKIPSSASAAMVQSLRKHTVPLFFRKDLPLGRDPVRNLPCPCQVGNIYQILHSAGVNVDAEIPWMREWMLKYQMEDGGLSCDETAYHAQPQASSMVGTIAALEAILFCTDRAFTSEERKFLEKGGRCLIDRKLMRGCSNAHNAEEKGDEADWQKLCFPRFYLYDILRGLYFILRWSHQLKIPIEADSIKRVMEIIGEKFPDSAIKIERKSYAGVSTLLQNEAGEWLYKQPAALFPLLEEVSELGQVSPYLSHQWNECLDLIENLIDENLIL